MSSIITQNRNRAHAVKQLQRGLKKASHTEEHIEDGVGDVQLLGSIANSLIYIGDILKDMNDKFSQKWQGGDLSDEIKDLLRQEFSEKGIPLRSDSEIETLNNDDDIPF